MSLKRVLVLLCVAAAALAETYTDKYDNVDIKEVMENKRLLTAYVNCILDRGKCSPEGKELKANMKEAVETGCEKCNDVQKDRSSTMINHLIKNEPEIWNELCAKFDPTGKNKKVYEERARANGVNI